jgi:hypothetical protein
MTKKQEDRRKAKTDPVFPLIDSEGEWVKSDRRRSKDRRKNYPGDDIASKIIDIIN